MNVMVSRGEVHAVVEQAYGLRVVGPLVDLPQGVHSQTWLAHTSDDDWVVKVSDPRSDPPASLAAQCELYDFLNSRGLHVPDVRADRFGHPVSSIDNSGMRYPVTLMRYHQLRRLTPEFISPAELRRVASQIARLHTTMDDFARKDEIVADRVKSHDEWGRHVTGCYQDLIESPTAIHFTATERSWLDTIDSALGTYLDSHYPDPASLSQTVLHGDLSFEHLRLLPNGEVYVFDFGDMCWGPVAHELAQFLRSFQDAPISFERWADLRHWLLEGYRARHVFTATDAAAIDVFLLNRVPAMVEYILELNGNNASASSAETIKGAYRLAEAMLRASG